MIREDSNGVLGGRAKKISAGPVMKKLAAAVWLIVSPAILARLLTGATPPDVFFHPVSLVLLTALYGGGALLIREMSIAWGTGWRGRVLMAAAYAIIQEGFTVKSFFGYGDVRVSPAFYIDNAGGIYWFWIFCMIFFHAVYSILLPIAIAEAAVGESDRRERWTGDGFLGAIFILYALVVCVGFLGYQDEKLAANWRLKTIVSLAAAVALVFTAYRNNKSAATHKSRKPGRAIFYFAEFLFFSAAYLFVARIFSRLILSAGIANFGLGVLAAILLIVVAVIRARSRFGAANFKTSHLVAAVWGILTPWILLTPYLEWDNANRLADTTGMTAVGISVLILLIVWTRFALKRSSRKLTQNTDFPPE